ncbi:MAG: hypothetical protein WA369_01375 [Candidatus Acidiferrales bacterium]
MAHPMRRLFALLLSCLIAAAASAQRGMPSERNAALRYWLAFAEMHDPPADKSLADLLEKTAAGEAPWDEAKLGPILDQNTGAILMMQRATKLPDCDWGLDYSQGAQASIAYVPRGRVLARLNTLYGMRLAAKGDTEGAVETWLDGIRFSQDLAKGGSLIFALIGSTAMRSNMHALEQEAQSGKLDAAQKTGIESAVRALPETGFDWGQAMRMEELAAEVTVRQMSEAADPAAYYREVWGKPTPADFGVPTKTDIVQFHTVMAAGEAALELQPDATQARIPAIEARIKALQPIVRDAVPSYERVNDVRVKVRAQRRQLLDALAAPKGSRR